MAGHRVHHSRPSTVLLVAVVGMLCFLRLLMDGSHQGFALPSDGKATKAGLQKLTVKQLKGRLREKGLKVSGRKADLVERLMEQLTVKSTSVVARKIAVTDEPADFTTDVFIPLNDTIRKLEALLNESRVVFLRAGVASGKSTLVQYLCTSQSSKYLQVHVPEARRRTCEGWEMQLRRALLKEMTTADVANGELEDAFKRLDENAQVLVFDECHVLFSSPKFYEQFLKRPSYLKRRPMVLLLSAASEAQCVEGQLHFTPPEIKAKFMWTPPMPDLALLAHELAAADVLLSEDAVRFFIQICGGHRGIFMTAMKWVQVKQTKTNSEWAIGQAYSEVKLAWENGDWGDAHSFLGALANVRAIRVNGQFADLAQIPREFLEVLCGGPKANVPHEVRRSLTIHGFLLPAYEASVEEFVPLDWTAVSARYGVANHLLASYYRHVLERTRRLEVEISRNPSSCIDLLLRAVPYLNFVTVLGALTVENGTLQSAFTERGLPPEVHYTGATIQVLKRLGFGADSVEDVQKGKVDIYVTQPSLSTFAIEAVMASQGPKAIQKHRARFDTLQNYRDSDHKCLLIIGTSDSKMSEAVGKVHDGIEVVGLAANPAHTEYRVYVKRQSDGVLDFTIPCDAVARSFSFKASEPFFEISSAQKFKSIEPGWSSIERKAHTMRCTHLTS